MLIFKEAMKTAACVFFTLLVAGWAGALEVLFFVAWVSFIPAFLLLCSWIAERESGESFSLSRFLKSL